MADYIFIILYLSKAKRTRGEMRKKEIDHKDCPYILYSSQKQNEPHPKFISQRSGSVTASAQPSI